MPTAIRRAFGADARSLAAARVGLAAIVLFDLAQRARFLVAWHTDVGVIPRAAVWEAVGDTAWLPFPHFLSGSTWAAALLLLLHAMAGLALLVGWRSRLATVVTFLLTLSLHHRTGPLLQSGDAMLRLALFWGCFVPWGARWSVDRALSPEREEGDGWIASMGTAGFLLQLAFVYWFTFLLKLSPPWFGQGSAVWMALQIDAFATPLGLAMRDLPAPLLRALTWGTLAVEALGPFLIFLSLRGRLRVAAVLIFTLLHLGFGAALAIGTFTWVPIAAWLAVLPGWAWEGMDRRLRPAGPGPQVWYDGQCGFCRRSVALLQTALMIREPAARPAQEVPSIHERMVQDHSWVVEYPSGVFATRFPAFVALCRGSPVARWIAPILALRPVTFVGNHAYRFVSHRRGTGGRILGRVVPARPSWRLGVVGSACAALALVFVAWVNLVSVMEKPEIPPGILKAGRTIGLGQRWAMFAPFPGMTDGWLVARATWPDGHTGDLMRDGAPVTFERPGVVSLSLPNQHWRKYVIEWPGESRRAYRGYLTDYLCRTQGKYGPGDGAPGGMPELVEMLWVLELTRLDGKIARPIPMVFDVRRCGDGEPVRPLVQPDFPVREPLRE